MSMTNRSLSNRVSLEKISMKDGPSTVSDTLVVFTSRVAFRKASVAFSGGTAKPPNLAVSSKLFFLTFG